jgi:hypothetical protein
VKKFWKRSLTFYTALWAVKVNFLVGFTKFYKKLGLKVSKKELNYLASKRKEKVWCQELRSTPYKQEIDPKLVR